MELLDTLIIKNPTATQSCRLELYHGDLTNMQPEEAVDVLVVSAFKGQYYPARSTLIGAQPGHEGHTLSWNETPDQIVDHLPDQWVVRMQGGKTSNFAQYR